ncbi:class I SAM-dependent DNA methyltransferase [Hyphococcus sp.]|uniref:class I SAM-dependent DNA methyltransferase n=1 Tax=Hyphococcus sp. TaxID=2038636 RepID=UPI0035C727F4
MTPEDFIRKWTRSELKESAAAQSHFNDLCDLLGEPKPTDIDQKGEEYCFEKGATKATGGQGFADVWRRGHFGWEYKGPHKDLDRAYRQLLTYSVALENPPLLVVSDTKKIIIRTNWTNTVQETHALELEDLRDAGKRDILRAVLADPEKLKPKKTRTQLTADAANEFSALAQRLRERGHDPHLVAHFVNRLVFCMFAEDAGLLPDSIFTRMLEMCARKPAEFEENARQLFGAMKEKGGRVGFEKIEWFNGGLFDDDLALPLDADDIELTLKAARLDWQDIDPSILGTLFERGLDPSKRSQLGAHYTDRDKIMMIVNPVIVDPLTAEWEATKEKIAAQLAKEGKAKSASAATRAHKAAVKLHRDFIDKLVDFRVLDPACGSGNFLNLSLTALKDLEHKANLDAEAMGLPRGFPRVGPEAVKGIEINPYAAELARVSIWIGEIQWMRRNGFDAARNPILRPLNNIECRDALIEQDAATGEWREATWPDADVIVGNPPFLGDKKMYSVLGRTYTDNLRRIFIGRLKGRADLVTYWFEKASHKLTERTKRTGLVATNSIRQASNRTVLEKILTKSVIFCAWDDEPWIVDGASVRVALICFGENIDKKIWLDGIEVKAITADLKAISTDSDTDTSAAVVLRKNQGLCYQGIKRVGKFEIPRELAVSWIKMPINPNGKSNAIVLRPWASGFDIVRRPQNYWIVDFGWDTSESEASLFEAPFEYLKTHVKPERVGKREKRANEMWWIYYWPRPEMRKSIADCKRYFARPSVAKHFAFRWLHKEILPDGALVVVARDDDTAFGITHSIFHEIWSLRRGSTLEDRPAYTPTTCFETYPFPEGLTPDIPAAEYADDPRAIRIAEAAAKLNELRENWLNPPDLVKRVPEVVEGYPDRILAVDEKAEKILKKRTLTNLYNERPAWLDHAHKALDQAVAASYGWEADFDAGTLTDDEILKRLFELNQARAAAQ